MLFNVPYYSASNSFQFLECYFIFINNLVLLDALIGWNSWAIIYPDDVLLNIECFYCISTFNVFLLRTNGAFCDKIKSLRFNDLDNSLIISIRWIHLAKRIGWCSFWWMFSALTSALLFIFHCPESAFPNLQCSEKNNKFRSSWS